MGGNYLDFDIDREAARPLRADRRRRGGRHPVRHRRDERVLVPSRGCERYPINVRYPRELRDNVEALKARRWCRPRRARRCPLSQLATIRIHQGPPAIKSENARPNAWVYVDLRGIDVGTWVKRAQKEVAEQVQLPAGYTIFWSGQYEYMQRAKARLLVIVPITLFLIFLILYINTKSLVKTAIVLLAVPFSIVGAVWFLYLLGYHWSIAVWVGIIALARPRRRDRGGHAPLPRHRLRALAQARAGWRTTRSWPTAVDHGAVQRIRPKMMTVMAILLSLVPIMWATAPARTSCAGSRRRWSAAS